MNIKYKLFGDLRKDDYIYRLRYSVPNNVFKSERLLIVRVDNDSLDTRDSSGNMEILNSLDWNRSHLANLAYENYTTDVHYFSDIRLFKQFVKQIKDSLVNISKF